MKIKAFALLTSVCLLGFLVLLFGPKQLAVKADDSLSSTAPMITISATVLPYRAVVMDENRHIKMVVSNSRLETEPTFVQDELAGPVLSSCQACREAYDKLEPELNFSLLGTVYSTQ